MLKRNLNSHIDNEPRTLRSDLPSSGIPICKPSHLSALSLESNSLQISQSPTRCFVTQKDKNQMSGVQALSMNVNLQEEHSVCGSVPSDTIDDTTNQTGAVSDTFVETKNAEKEMLVSNEESNNQSKEHELKRQPPTDFSVSPSSSENPSTKLSSEPSFGTSSRDENNPSCATYSNIPSERFAAPPPTSPFFTDIPSGLKFFNFVILHVPDDQEEAGRVCQILNNLQIGEGTTFCEGFETAGISPLKCLEDAVENSAYIVLLLTTGFLSRWGKFQTNVVLMNSIEDENKSGTVIPLIPKSETLKCKIPLGLQSLIKLEEKSFLFEKQVRNTFKWDMIKRQQELWNIEQDLRTKKKCLEHAKDLSNSFEIKQQITMDIQAIFSHLTAQMSSMMSNLPAQVFPGSVIHINNSSNVQIGNQNSMNVQKTTNVPQLEMSEECYEECNNDFQGQF
ncbi:TIR domain-containing adapter molecule 1 [Bufo bufo]|uniref:TIR domain-containing adapter molecule 1 n=1 Tax=Bufo bufo TaxID=8384 RepID=UPI001ABDB23C|nr:TIR domain-containing adapter molecule 1 [Bufo bufo]XP_040273665.1 TIR domain-containing adapter molecule 1 [Bufo bufo]